METIAAISTAIGNGGIGIIRMSGKESFEILQKIFCKNRRTFPEVNFLAAGTAKFCSLGLTGDKPPYLGKFYILIVIYSAFEWVV